jgi:hypothetical protein
VRVTPALLSLVLPPQLILVAFILASCLFWDLQFDFSFVELDDGFNCLSYQELIDIQVRNVRPPTHTFAQWLARAFGAALLVCPIVLLRRMVSRPLSFRTSLGERVCLVQGLLWLLPAVIAIRTHSTMNDAQSTNVDHVTSIRGEVDSRQETASRTGDGYGESLEVLSCDSPRKPTLLERVFTPILSLMAVWPLGLFVLAEGSIALLALWYLYQRLFRVVGSGPYPCMDYYCAVVSAGLSCYFVAYIYLHPPIR